MRKPAGVKRTCLPKKTSASPDLEEAHASPTDPQDACRIVWHPITREQRQQVLAIAKGVAVSGARCGIPIPAPKKATHIIDQRDQLDAMQRMFNCERSREGCGVRDTSHPEEPPAHIETSPLASTVEPKNQASEDGQPAQPPSPATAAKAMLAQNENRRQQAAGPSAHIETQPLASTAEAKNQALEDGKPLQPPSPATAAKANQHPAQLNPKTKHRKMASHLSQKAMCGMKRE